MNVIIQSLVGVCLLYTAESISMGDYISITEAPYFVSLLYGGNSKESYCGGAILSEYWIITAAHCIELQDYPLRVRTGSTTQFNGKSIHKIDKVFIHGDHDIYYNQFIHHVDIALLRLKTPLSFNKYQQPIKLYRSTPKVNDTVITFGLGYEAESRLSISLKKTVLRVLPYESQHFDSVFYTTSFNSDICPGDSGSPAIINNEVAGVSASAPGICMEFERHHKADQSGFARIHQYYDWIINVTNIQE